MTPTIKQIFITCSNVMQVEPQKVRTRSRKRELSDTRMFICLFLWVHHGSKTTKGIRRKPGTLGTQRIAKIVNLTNHATVIFNRRTIQNLIDTDKMVRSKFNEIEAALLN